MREGRAIKYAPICINTCERKFLRTPSTYYRLLSWELCCLRTTQIHPIHCSRLFRFLVVPLFVRLVKASSRKVAHLFLVRSVLYAQQKRCHIFFGESDFFSCQGSNTGLYFEESDFLKSCHRHELAHYYVSQIGLVMKIQSSRQD